jgi:chemotaxis signal transduction protein
MSASAQPAEAAAPQRVILFEVGASAYAIPIADVLEVTDWAPWAGVPGLPRHLAGVVNHHGDALPVLSRESLFEAGGEGAELSLPPPQSLLVLAARGGEAGRLGLPVDRVLGLEEAPLGAPQGSGVVVERLPLRGRIVCILDGRRTLARAAALIDGVVAGTSPH